MRFNHLSRRQSARTLADVSTQLRKRSPFVRDAAHQVFLHVAERRTPGKALESGRLRCPHRPDAAMPTRSSVRHGGSSRRRARKHLTVSLALNDSRNLSDAVIFSKRLSSREREAEGKASADSFIDAQWFLCTRLRDWDLIHQSRR